MNETIHLASLRAFAAVAEHQSFTGAARALGQPKATISRAVATLEAELGVQLLHRTTRRVSLTPAGADLYDRVQPALDTLGLALSEVRGQAQEPAGLLRVTTTTDLGVTLVGRAVATLLHRHPRLRVELIPTLRVVDLVAERVDAAVRVSAGLPIDTRLTGRRVGELSIGWFASPDYLRRRGAPTHADQLGAHDLVGFSATSTPNTRAIVDDPFAALALVREGIGVGMLPHVLCEADVASGALVPVLPDQDRTSAQLWLVYPSGRVSANVAAFRDVLLEEVAHRPRCG